MKREVEIESEIQAKGLNAPRLNPQMIDDAIVSEQYHVFPGTTVTVCALTLRNGFVVVGESAAASPENFDAEIGRKIARDRARDKIWALEGYALRNWLFGLDVASSDSVTVYPWTKVYWSAEKGELVSERIDPRDIYKAD